MTHIPPLLLLLIVFVGSSAQAQTNPPPPPPPVRISVKGDRAKPSSADFVSEKGGFRVTFPSKPSVNVIPYESSFGNSSMVAHTVGTAFASYGVVYLDFPTIMSDRYDLNVRFDSMRDANLKRMSGRVLSENEYFFGTNYGREMVIEGQRSTLTSRSFVVGPRLFVLTVETPGQMSSQSEKLRTANKDRIKRFFDSFAVTRTIEAAEERVELPRDFGVVVEEGVFRSQYFNATLKIPQDWIVMERDDAEHLFELGKEEVNRSDPALAAHITNETARILSIFAKNDPETGVPAAMILVMAERAPYPSFLPTAVARSYEQLYLDPTESVVRYVSKLEINGVEFAWLETYDDLTESYNRMFFANRQGIAFEVIVAYSEEQDLDAMLRSVNTLRFGQDNAR